MFHDYYKMLSYKIVNFFIILLFCLPVAHEDTFKSHL